MRRVGERLGRMHEMERRKVGATADADGAACN